MEPIFVVQRVRERQALGNTKGPHSVPDPDILYGADIVIDRMRGLGVAPPRGDHRLGWVTHVALEDL